MPLAATPVRLSLSRLETVPLRLAPGNHLGNTRAHLVVPGPVRHSELLLPAAACPLAHLLLLDASRSPSTLRQTGPPHPVPPRLHRVKFVCLLPVRDEADIIAQSLRHFLLWADEIYLFDTGSLDPTWEIVQDIASREKRLKPLRKDPVYFSET